MTWRTAHLHNRTARFWQSGLALQQDLFRQCHVAACVAQGREKINLVYLFTKMGFSILVSDVDTVWMRNPLPYMAQYPEADILTSSDHLVGCTDASSVIAVCHT